jgi:hypothetical protein
VFVLGGIREVTIAPPAAFGLSLGARASVTPRLRLGHLRLGRRSRAWIAVNIRDTAGDNELAWHRIVLQT